MQIRSFAIAGALFIMEALSAQPAWENPVKKLLREGKPVIGASIQVSSAESAAQIANMGFDFLWIEMEHSPITLETARNMILATRGLKAVPFIRVPVNEIWTAKRALDAGAMGVVFPFTSTPELARQAVAACKYPPLGRRGSGAGLAMFRWPPGAESYQDIADKNAMVITIIEAKRAVDAVDAIAATPGIDVLFIGTSDLSFSYGKRGDSEDPEVQAAIRKIVEAKKNNVPVGRPAGTPEAVKRFMEEGFTFFQGPTELGMIRTGAAQLLTPFDKTGFDPKKQPLY